MQSMLNPETRGCGHQKKDNCSCLQKQRKILFEPYEHLRQWPLPDVWGKLAVAFNGWLNIPAADFKMVKNLTEMQQYNDIILDDIKDDRKLRGSIPTVHSKYGEPNALGTFFYVLSETINLMVACNPKLQPFFTHSAKSVCLSRCMQLLWSDRVSCPTEEEYYRMIIRKNQGLLTNKIQYMQLFSNNKKDFGKLCELFGLYLHIRDDYRRLTSNPENDDWLSAEITHARFSLPMIHAINTKSVKGEKINQILRQRSKNEFIKQYVVKILESTGSFAYTRRVLGQLKQELLKELKKFETNSLIQKIVEEDLTILSDGKETSTAPTTDHDKISSFISQITQPEPQDEYQSVVKEMLKPLDHLRTEDGKNVRLKFIEMLQVWIQVPEEKVEIVKHVGEFLHECSLILDDVQDSANIRRGIPCSYLIYGAVNTVNTVVYRTAVALEHAVSMNHPKASEAFGKGIEQLCRGQGMDIYCRENFICPTESEYFEISAGKTGALISIVGDLMDLFRGVDKSPVWVLKHLGTMFQLNDDYQNIVNPLYHKVKGFCEDITEGKFSWPILHAIDTHPEEAKKIKDIIRQKPSDVETIKYCVSLIEKCGSLEYTKKKIAEMKADFARELKPYGLTFDAIDNLLKKMDVF